MSEANVYRGVFAILPELSYDDWEDAYGTASNYFFGIAEVLYSVAPESIPDHWEYRHSPFPAKSPAELRDSLPESFVMDALDSGRTVADLVHVGTVLVRYIRLLPAERKY